MNGFGCRNSKILQGMDCRFLDQNRRRIAISLSNSALEARFGALEGDIRRLSAHMYARPYPVSAVIKVRNRSPAQATSPRPGSPQCISTFLRQCDLCQCQYSPDSMQYSVLYLLSRNNMASYRC
jgi:hypothetical protein